MNQSEALSLAYQVSQHTGIAYVAKLVNGKWTIVPRAEEIARIVEWQSRQ